MTTAEFLAKFDKITRKYILKTNPLFATWFYSNARKIFLDFFINEKLFPMYKPPKSEKIELWDLEFQSPIFNAAGMFKTGNGYQTVASQGAGAFLTGTTTYLSRRGNIKYHIRHPFIPYPSSHSASNWMGLPNDGHLNVAKKISNISKIKGCPVGASLSLDVEIDENIALVNLLQGFKAYEKANVDFLELNESCPNVSHSSDLKYNLDENLINRLEYISDNFLKSRTKNLPVIVKLSTDTDLDLLPKLIDLLIDLEFDGINFGNTSTDYKNFEQFCNIKDKKNFEYFHKIFGGGLSGKFLKNKSLLLCKNAINYLNSKSLRKEFNIIRTGGIESYSDIIESRAIGVKLNQWFTAYFENFAKYGHRVYKNLFD